MLHKETAAPKQAQRTRGERLTSAETRKERGSEHEGGDMLLCTPSVSAVRNIRARAGVQSLRSVLPPLFSASA